MSGGERSCLRLSQKISRLDNALVLIDEIEAALHPYTQQLLMLELQRMALRQNIQVVVSTHSPAILDTVPPEARIFLDRTNDDIVVQTPYRDLLQNAFYGRSFDKLSILCEDEIAEAVIRGVMDCLNPRLGLRSGDIVIGRDTGKSEFAAHVRAVAKFNELEDFIFVLDGDAANEKGEAEAAAKPSDIKALLLPGDRGPEAWCIERIGSELERYAEIFGETTSNLTEEYRRLEAIYDSATTRRGDIPKNIFRDISEFVKRQPTEAARLVAHHEATRNDGKSRGDMSAFMEDLGDAITAWRSRSKTTH